MNKGGTRQIAALPWRKNARGQIEVLLITSRETKRWVIPKGWPMQNLQDYNAARQEAFEEAGVEGRMCKTPLGRFVYDKLKKSGLKHPLEVAVFSMEVNKVMPHWPEEHERKRQWFSLGAAENNVAEPDLKLIIKQFQR